MKNVTTYVGIDAHKKDLFVAMLMGHEKTPVTWQLANEPTCGRSLPDTAVTDEAVLRNWASRSRL